MSNQGESREEGERQGTSKKPANAIGLFVVVMILVGLLVAVLTGVVRLAPGPVLRGEYPPDYMDDFSTHERMGLSASRTTARVTAAPGTSEAEVFALARQCGGRVVSVLNHDTYLVRVTDWWGTHDRVERLIEDLNRSSLIGGASLDVAGKEF